MDGRRPKQQAICEASGFKVDIDRLVKQWDGAYVLGEFCDRRNPQDFVTGVPDNQAPRLSRPESADVFIETTISPGDL